jgi:hypothetical protein
MKECLRVVIGIIALILFLIPLLRLYRFSKELKKEEKDRILSETLVENWNKNFYAIIAFIIVGMILALLFSFLS